MQSGFGSKPCIQRKRRQTCYCDLLSYSWLQLLFPPAVLLWNDWLCIFLILPFLLSVICGERNFAKSLNSHNMYTKKVMHPHTYAVFVCTMQFLSISDFRSINKICSQKITYTTDDLQTKKFLVISKIIFINTKEMMNSYNVLATKKVFG